MSRTIAFALSLTMLLTGSARSDEPRLCLPTSMVSPSMPLETRLSLSRVLEDDQRAAGRMRRAGIATTALGLVVTAVGAGVMMRSFLCDSCGSGAAQTISGITLTTIGPLLFITGIPVWAVGQSRVNRATGGRIALAASGATLSF